MESEWGKGSIFRVEFPEVDVPSIFPMSPQVPGVLADVEGVKFQDSLVLVTDDVESNRRLMREFLQSLDVSTLEAENGEQAVRFAREYKPNLILMDIRMPVMDGYEATQIIKKDEELKHIPVVVLTASAMRNQEEEIKKANCDGYLTKPINKNELIAELMRFLPYGPVEEKERAVDTGGEEQEILTPEAAALLPELLDILENQLTERWKWISDVFVIGDIEDFALEIKELGSQYHLKILTDWGDKLLKQIRSYDMENAPVTLEYFPELIEQIKNLFSK